MCPCSYFFHCPLLRKNESKPKKRDFLSKSAKGRKLSNPGRTQQQRKIMTRMGSEIKTKGKAETKQGLSKTQIKQMFIIEVVIDN